MRGFAGSLTAAVLAFALPAAAHGAQEQSPPADAPAAEPLSQAEPPPPPADMPETAPGGTDRDKEFVCQLTGDCGAAADVDDDREPTRGFSIARPAKAAPSPSAAKPAATGYNRPRAAASRPGIFRAPTSRKIVLAPGSGQLWMLNAFDFKACQAKKLDPWDHERCGWSQFAPGDNTPGLGRYMFEIRWPDGKVERGARVVDAPGEEPSDRTLVFKRN